MNEDRLTHIEKKVDRLVVLMEGIHGAEGLVAQVYDNKRDISDLKKLVYKAIGTLTLIVPLITLTIRALI